MEKGTEGEDPEVSVSEEVTNPSFNLGKKMGKSGSYFEQRSGGRGLIRLHFRVCQKKSEEQRLAIYQLSKKRWNRRDEGRRLNGTNEWSKEMLWTDENYSLGRYTQPNTREMGI